MACRLEPEKEEAELQCGNLGLLLRLNLPFQDLCQVPCTFSSPVIIHRLSLATKPLFFLSKFLILPFCDFPSISLNALCTGSDLHPLPLPPPTHAPLRQGEERDCPFKYRSDSSKF